jgi:hypothetical protein
MARNWNCFAAALMVLALSSPSAHGETRRWTFADDPPGAIAKGFTGEGGAWSIVRTDAGNVLAQSAKSADSMLNLTLARDVSARSIDMSVRMKAIGGTIAQGGGLAWRALDAKNYYVCRYDPLQNNFQLFKVIDGKPWMLQTADLEKSPGWHMIGVSMSGEHIECFFDGRNYLNFDDPSINAAGKIGLWTEADAQTQFQDLTLAVP